MQVVCPRGGDLRLVESDPLLVNITMIPIGLQIQLGGFAGLWLISGRLHRLHVCLDTEPALCDWRERVRLVQ